VPTKLEKDVKRELEVDGEPYILTISPTGLKLTRKGRRKGQELAWKALVSGEAALAVALNASLRSAPKRATAKPPVAAPSAPAGHGGKPHTSRR
jgi:hypothetical protein